MQRSLLHLRPVRLRPPSPSTFHHFPLTRFHPSILHGSPLRYRPFTTNAALLLLLSRPSIRPQLPFLHFHTIPPKPTALISRLLTTESRSRWRARFWWQLRFHAYFWPMCVLLMLAYSGIDQSLLEQTYPTPREWSFWSRWYLRSAKHAESQDQKNWMRIGLFYALLLERLENPDLDGANLLESLEGGILVDGIGKTGFDLSAKSEHWRRGYYDALMGCARVGEHLSGYARLKDRTDRRRGTCWAKECIPGPQNPKPRPVKWGEKEAPSHAEVEDAWDDPLVYYMKILTTTNGFNTKQRMDAALAYADWLGFEGLKESAESVLDWGLDIALSGLPVGVNGVVNTKSGVLDARKTEHVTSNLLKALTAKAVHHASTGDVKAALPIFLSVLQARKELPVEPSWARDLAEKDTPRSRNDGWSTYLSLLRDFFFEPPYPPSPSSGDTRPFHTLQEACEEVGLMTYIGEILYATSDREKGLSWTRDAVDAAEAVMWVMQEDGREDGKQTCRQCLETGLDNWRKMAKTMAIEAEKREAAGSPKRGLIGGESEREKAGKEARKWEEEEAKIELRREKTMPLIHPVQPAPTGWFSL